MYTYSLFYVCNFMFPACRQNFTYGARTAQNTQQALSIFCCTINLFTHRQIILSDVNSNSKELKVSTSQPQTIRSI